MYPLNAILIGRDEKLLPHVRRELMNCSCELEAEYLNVQSAVAAIRLSTGDKRLIVLHLGTEHEVDALARLNVSLPGWPVVVLMGEDVHANGARSDGIIGLMRAGASQIVSLPLKPHDFKAVLDRIAIQFVYSLSESKVIAVAGATGGSGATTLAINLAFEIALQHGLRCVLVDLSLRMGVIAPHLDIKPDHTILDLLGDISRLDTVLAQKVLIRVADNFEILAGPHELVAPTGVTSQDLANVNGILKQLAAVVVLDVPCTYDDIYFGNLPETADRVVLIGEQKLPSIRALKMVHDRLGRASKTEFLVINRFDPGIKGFAANSLLAPLGVTRLNTVTRDDVAMRASVEAGCVLRHNSPQSRALTDVVFLAKCLLNIDTPVAVKPSGLFTRLGRAIANK